jgi:hypothetical protein
MHMQHQLLLDVLDFHPGQGRSDPAGVMAHAANDLRIDAGITVGRRHLLLLCVVVAEKRAVSGS